MDWRDFQRVDDEEEALRNCLDRDKLAHCWESGIEGLAVQRHRGLNVRPSRTLSVSCWNMRRVSIRIVVGMNSRFVKSCQRWRSRDVAKCAIGRKGQCISPVLFPLGTVATSAMSSLDRSY